MALQADQDWDMEMLGWVRRLLCLMSPEDQIAACRFVAELKICKVIEAKIGGESA
jgi:hypothetical protein